MLLRQVDCGYTTLSSFISSGIGLKKVKGSGIHFWCWRLGPGCHTHKMNTLLPGPCLLKFTYFISSFKCADIKLKILSYVNSLEDV